MKSNNKITSFFCCFSINMKKKCFDRKSYRALDNKANHCGRMPEVDKWRDGNVSTTSAICFLCWEFFFLRPLCSLSLCLISLLFLSYLSAHPVILSPLHFPHVYFLFFFLSLSLCPCLTCLSLSISICVMPQV